MPKQSVRGRKRVTFSLDAETGQKVFVAGTFNDWTPGEKPLKERAGSGHYEATMLLFPGVYEYKFVVNGDWCMDPAGADWVANDFGSLNSVVRVG